MLPQKEPVGVIIGRFQVPYLHEGHKSLIQTVLENHSRVLLFLGLSPLKGTVINPLDFETRKKMILNYFPDLTILYIKDTKDDKVWSEKLDEMIIDIIGPNQKAILYGGRDSFIKHYFGRFPTKELKQDKFISGTEIRIKVSSKIKDTEDFRIGCIYTTQNQYPQSIPTVDAAIFNEDYSEILLGRKKDESQYRFIGGFVPPKETWEQTVRREVMEETGLEITGIQYVKSFFIDDWRFKNEINKITTSLFTCKVLYGKPQPNDDIHELKWFKFDNINLDEIVVEHREMLEYLQKFMKQSSIYEQVEYRCKQCGKHIQRDNMIWWVGDIYCQDCYEKLDK